VVAVLIVEEVAVTPFAKPKPVPRRHVVIANAGVPGSLEGLVRTLIADHFELVAEGHAAKTELDRRHVTPALAASLGRVGGGPQNPARKDAAGCQCQAGRSDAKEISSRRCRHGSIS